MTATSLTLGRDCSSCASGHCVSSPAGVCNAGSCLDQLDFEGSLPTSRVKKTVTECVRFLCCLPSLKAKLSSQAKQKLEGSKTSTMAQVVWLNWRINMGFKLAVNVLIAF